MKKYNGTVWVDTTLRQYKTATADIEPTIYTDGTAITSYTIKGNSVQAGTPTPSNPIPVEGVGELDSGQYKIPISSGGVTTNIYLGSTQTARQIKKLVFDGSENWKFGTYPYLDDFLSYGQDYLRQKINICICSHLQSSTNIQSGEAVVPDTCCFLIEGYSGVFYYKDTSVSDLASFKSWLADQYAAGTPVTVWYVLATPETATVNEPLMKIGDYADTLSNATSIPTTEGANSITVDTTVQPSEFTATWTGWHDSSVKEYDGTIWQ